MMLTTTHAGTPVSISVKGRLYRVTPDFESGLDECYALDSGSDRGWLARAADGSWHAQVAGRYVTGRDLNDLAARLWA